MAIDALLRQFLSDFRIEPCGIVVAVSGGADSTCLLLALHELASDGYEITAAHVNHKLRGTESDEDESFVSSLCRAHGIPLHVESGELNRQLVRSSGVEAAARRVRYEILESIRSQRGARYVATGHTRGDQAETLIMRFLTGSGTGRLQGVLPVKGTVIRPLLEADRDEVLSSLRERGIEPRSDSSNDDPRFLRNRIRHAILPMLLEINPNLPATLAETARQARSEQAILDRVIRESSAEWIEESPDSSRLNLERAPSDRWLLQAGLARQIRRLDPAGRDVSAADLGRLAGQLGTLRRVSVARGLELLRSGEAVLLQRVPRPVTPPFELDITPEVPIDIPQIRKRFALRKRTSDGATGELIRLPRDGSASLTVRNRRAGDRFHPRGSSSQKSLSDLLIERRIPRELRDSIPILTWNGEIVSVVGLGVSRPFSAEGSGEEAYVIVLEDSE